MPTIDLPPEWLAMVLRLIALHLPDAEVWAYGSRVQGSAHEGSDFDLVARNRTDPERPVPGLGELRRAFSESGLPILVDVLDWALLPERFRNELARGKTVMIFDRKGKER